MSQPLELHLYDFDGTLFRSPEPPPGVGEDWWVAEQSLGQPCVPETPDASWWVGTTVAEAKRSIANKQVLAVLCTGRPDNSPFRWRVPELLGQKGLDFDLVRLNPGGSTTAFKSAVLRKALAKFPSITTVAIWEDDPKRLAVYEAFVTELGLLCVPHLVRASSKFPLCSQDSVLGHNKFVESPHISRLIQRIASRWVGRLAS